MVVGTRFDATLKSMTPDSDETLDEADAARQINNVAGLLRLATLFIVIAAGSIASARFV